MLDVLTPLCRLEAYQAAPVGVFWGVALGCVQVQELQLHAAKRVGVAFEAEDCWGKEEVEFSV